MHANVDLHGISREVKFQKTKAGHNMLTFNVEVSSEYRGQISIKTIPVMAFGKLYSAHQNSNLEGAEVMIKGSLTSKPNEYNGVTYHRLGINAQEILVLNAPRAKPLSDNLAYKELTEDEFPF